MSDQSCDTCTHWAALDDEIGQCRRHAPRPRPSTDDIRWPVTDSDDWCGEWEPVDCDCDDDEVCGICGPDPVDATFEQLVGTLIAQPKRRWWRRHRG